MGDASAVVDILDIRDCSDVVDNSFDLCNLIVRGLAAPFGAKTLPTLLLYDERGLKLYDKVTTDAPKYYLCAAEEEIVRRYASEIAQIMQSRSLTGGENIPSSVVLELGAGALRKTSLILSALAGLVSRNPTIPSMRYFALDLDQREIERTLLQLLNSDVGLAIQGKIEAKGMLGTFENGIAFVLQGGLLHVDNEGYTDSGALTKHKNPLPEPSATTNGFHQDADALHSTSVHPQLHLLFLGSSIGNFLRGEDAQFLRSLPLRAGYGDTILIGLDRDNDREEIQVAYNDSKGLNRSFILNGLRVAGTALGDPDLFDLGNWEYVNHYDEETRTHRGFCKCLHPHHITIPGTKEVIDFQKDECVKIVQSLKHSETDLYTLFTDANLRPIQRWNDSSLRCSLWLLERPPFTFPLLSSPSTPTDDFIGKRVGVPSMHDWKALWNAWDLVTLQMIPSSMLFDKSTELGRTCLFYLGHIPAFLDVHLSHLLQEPYTKPEEFKFIFERDIDLQIQQNDADFPSLSDIHSFKERVRERLANLYTNLSNATIQLTRKIARVLFVIYEREGMHTETLLSMLLQRAGNGTIPPPGFTVPPWDSLLTSWKEASKPPFPTVVIEATTVTLGIDDIEADDATKALDLEGHIYGWDNESPSRRVSVDAFRISWRPVTNGEFFKFYTSTGKDKVVFPASWEEHENGDVRVRTLYGPVSMDIAWDWPVLTSYNNLLVYASAKGGRLPTEPELRVFMDKFIHGYEAGANTGFRNWHPIPATTGIEKYGGQGHNGGVWEWTSTVFNEYEGFVPSRSYAGYAESLDGFHQVVLGGSFATIPQIAERRSMRNLYRHDYSYPWVGGRIVYNV